MLLEFVVVVYAERVFLGLNEFRAGVVVVACDLLLSWWVCVWSTAEIIHVYGKCDWASEGTDLGAWLAELTANW